jgi:AraC family transcriptional regulator
MFQLNLQLFASRAVPVKIRLMAIVGRGRIVVWEGASLWVFAGTTNQARTDFHSHHAIQVTFSLEGAFLLRTQSDELAGPIVAVAADASHIFEAHGAAAHLFIEPDGLTGRALSSLWFDKSSLKQVDGSNVQQILSRLADDFKKAMTDADLISMGKQLVRALAADVEPAKGDRRVDAMVSFVSDNLDDPLTLPMIASHVALSTGRASHLFVEQTGLPLRTYVLWRRVARAVELYSGGAALTEAAYGAGFADQAHLSRTFRRMFGLPAASLQVASS